MAPRAVRVHFSAWRYEIARISLPEQILTRGKEGRHPDSELRTCVEDLSAEGLGPFDEKVL